MASEREQNRFSSRYVNLAQTRLGARAVYVTDDFFAPAERMLQTEPAVFIPGKFDDKGKWMDGWESRRKRVEGYDYCIVKLGRAGVIRGVDIDTSHFNGNYPDRASIQAGYMRGGTVDSMVTQSMFWRNLLPEQKLEMVALLRFESELIDIGAVTHVRVNIIPDGGLSRVRLYGQIEK